MPARTRRAGPEAAEGKICVPGSLMMFFGFMSTNVRSPVHGGRINRELEDTATRLYAMAARGTKEAREF
jgi:hypothetical protein